MHSIRKRNDNYLKILLILFMTAGLCLSCNNSGRSEDNASAEGDVSSEVARDSSYIVEVTAADYAFGMPSEVPSGWVTFRMNNKGQEEHNAVIYRYSDTITYDGLIGMLSRTLSEKNYEYFSAPETAMGGPAILSPGLTGETTVLLEPGVYAITCWMVAEDGEFHAMKGMTRPFVVTNEDSGANKPKATVNITLEDVAINIEDSIPAGDHVFNVNFATMENVHLARLAEGQEFKELKYWMNKVQTPSPFTFLGGAEQAPVGMTNTFKAHLEPGRYALVTYGKAEAGMAEEFVIPESGAAPPVKNEPENSQVRMTFSPKENSFPEQLQTGRTIMSLKNEWETPNFYVLSLLKDGRTLEEFIQFTEDAYVHEKIDPFTDSRPSLDLWEKKLDPGETMQFNLDVQKATYVITGPISPDVPLSEQWKGKEMFHAFSGSGKM